MTEPDIINNPNHRHYGPARSLFIILSGITGDITDFGVHYFREWAVSPYRDLAAQLDGGVREGPALREIISRAFIAIDLR